MPLPVLNRRHKAGLFLVLVAAGVSLFLETSAKQTAGVVLLGIAAAWTFGSLTLRMLVLLSCALGCAVGFGILSVPVGQDWNSYRTSVQDYDSAIKGLRDTVAKAPKLPQAFGGLPQSKQYDYSQDKEFLSAPAHQQRAYLMANDPDYAKLSRKEQDAYIAYLQGQGATRTVEIPEAARKWMRPGAIEKWKQPDSKDSKWVDRKESDWVNVGTGEPDPRYTYPADVTTDEMVSFIQSNDLLPRPEFSVRASLHSHQITSTAGLALVLAGMLGNGLLLFRLRKSRAEVRVSIT